MRQDCLRIPCEAKSSAAGRQERRRRWRRETARRALFTERLESRMLMASDVSPLWNYYQPTDVNGDGWTTGLDAVVVVHDLNSNGGRSVFATEAGSGEDGETPMLDVNNDGWITGLDAVIVVAQLNAEGEGTPYARLVFEPVAINTNNRIDTIAKGDYFDLRVTTIDTLQTMFLGQTRNPTNFSSVAQTFFDLSWDTSKSEVQLSEEQELKISGSPTGGTFTLTINGQTTGDIALTGILNQTAQNIQNALNTRFGANRIVVTAVSDIGGVRTFLLKYVNQFAQVDQNEAANSGNAAGLTGGTSPTITFTESVKGATVAQSLGGTPFAAPRVVERAVETLSIPDGFGGSVNNPYYPNSRYGNLVGTGTLNDVGGLFNTAAPRPGGNPQELLRVRMNALAATAPGFPLSFTPDFFNVTSPSLDTVLYGFGNSITSVSRGDTLADIMARIETESLPLTITGPLSITNDTATMNEDDTPNLDADTGGVRIDVLFNDSDTSPGPQALSIASFTQPASGTVSLIADIEPGPAVRQGLRYMPPANFNSAIAPVTFTYTVTDGTNSEVGSVTVTVSAVNDAPAFNALTNPPTVNEDAGAQTATGFATGIGRGGGSDESGQAVTFQLTQTGSTGGLTFAAAPAISSTGDLTYTANPDSAGTATFSVVLQDNGGTANGGQNTSAARTFTITVNPQNDAPINTVPAAQAVDEGINLIFAPPTRALTVTDIDSATVTTIISTTAGVGGILTAVTGGGAVVTNNNSRSVTIVGAPAQVSAALNGLIYNSSTPQNDVLTISTSDGAGGSDVDTVNIQVNATTRPRAKNDTAPAAANSFQEGGGSLDIDVLLNDDINPGEQKILVSVTQPGGGQGTVAIQPAGGSFLTDFVRYTLPDSDFNGQVTFTYTLNETDNIPAGTMGNIATSGPSMATVTVNIAEVNDAPTAMDDPLSNVAEDSGQRTISFASLLGNDSQGPANESGQTLTITAVSNVVGGVAVISGTDILFTPASNYNGPASFDYTVRDNGMTAGAADPKSDIGTATFTITEVNDAPTAGGDPLSSIAEDSGNRTISFATLLANDGRGGGPDENGQTLTIISVSSPVGGTAAIMGTDVIFSPTSHFNGAASFTYTVQDNGATAGAADPKSANGAVTFTITPVNDAPVAVADLLYNTSEDVTLSVNAATGVLANDSDVDAGTTLTAILVSGITASQGTLNLAANGSFTYQPATDFVGTVEFTYKANDGTADSNTVTVRITVAEFNDPPTAGNFSFNTNEDTLLTVNIPGLAGAPSNDPEGSPLSVIITQQPPAGTLNSNGNGSFTYQPAGNASGSVTFKYRVNDGAQNSANEGTVTINVIEQNDPPTAVDNGSPSNRLVAIKNTAATPFVNQPYQVLANDSISPDVGETISITGVQAISDNGGSVAIGSGGEVLYTPAVDFEGADQFTYTISDSRGGVATATVYVNVVNFIPTNVTGRVFIDNNNNGVFDAGDAGVDEVELTISGTDLLTQTAITPITVQSQMDGVYVFPAMRPGAYRITESQPKLLQDGVERAGNGGALTATDDEILVTLPLLGIAGGSNGHTFAERGLDASQLTNPAGLTDEILASTGSNGFVMTESLTGEQFWSWALDGWSGARDVEITLDSDLKAATLLVSDSLGMLHTLRIFVSPNDPRNANKPVYVNGVLVSGSLARFRILGHNTAGDMLIRIDGSAANFGMSMAANFGAAQGEGEYAQDVDALMAEEAWA